MTDEMPDEIWAIDAGEDPLPNGMFACFIEPQEGAFPIVKYTRANTSQNEGSEALDTSDKGIKISQMEAVIEAIYILAGDEMPCAVECEDFFLRFDMSDFIDELKRWRKTHAKEHWNPDWCAAGSALKAQLTVNAELRQALQNKPRTEK